MNAWDTSHELIGRRVIINFTDYDRETATIIGVRGKMIRVMADDGKVYTGNSWRLL